MPSQLHGAAGFPAACAFDAHRGALHPAMRRLVVSLAAGSALAIGLLVGLPGTSRASDCTRDTTGLVALTDLGPGLYQGRVGGLYPGGVNGRPAAHDMAGIAIAQSIVPLDTLGNSDPAQGRIVLISIGMSNATQEFQAFVPKAMSEPSRHPRLAVIDCALGGQSADRIRGASAAYWDSVATRLRGHGSSPAQAQVAWIKEADAGPTGGFPAATDTLRDNLAAVVRVLQQRCPNLKLVFLTSRIYAGYATTNLNPEPYAYESGFALKWLIEEQLAGVDSLNFDPAAGPKVAPWLAWGPYLWADGTRGRADGLIWPCSWFAADGTHPGTLARNAVADSLLAFFKLDPAATPWFLAPVVGVPSAGSARTSGLRMTLAPASNPARGLLAVDVEAPAGRPWRVELFDARGRRVGELGRGIGQASGQRVATPLTALRTGGVAPGAYRLRLTCDGMATSRGVVVIGSR